MKLKKIVSVNFCLVESVTEIVRVFKEKMIYDGFYEILHEKNISIPKKQLIFRGNCISLAIELRQALIEIGIQSAVIADTANRHAICICNGRPQELVVIELNFNPTVVNLGNGIPVPVMGTTYLWNAQKLEISSKNDQFEYSAPFHHIDAESIEMVQNNYLKTGIFSIGKQHPSKSVSFIQFNCSKGQLLLQHKKIRFELYFEEWKAESMKIKLASSLNSTELQAEDLFEFLGINADYLVDSILTYKSDPLV